MDAFYLSRYKAKAIREKEMYERMEPEKKTMRVKQTANKKFVLASFQRVPRAFHKIKERYARIYESKQEILRKIT